MRCVSYAPVRRAARPTRNARRHCDAHTNLQHAARHGNWSVARSGVKRHGVLRAASVCVAMSCALRLCRTGGFATLLRNATADAADALWQRPSPARSSVSLCLRHGRTPVALLTHAAAGWLPRVAPCRVSHPTSSLGSAAKRPAARHAGRAGGRLFGRRRRLCAEPSGP